MHNTPDIPTRHEYDFGHYYNENGVLLGHYAEQVNCWIAAHPDYRGPLFFDSGDGGNDVDVTDIFYPAEDSAAAAETSLHCEAA